MRNLVRVFGDFRTGLLRRLSNEPRDMGHLGGGGALTAFIEKCLHAGDDEMLDPGQQLGGKARITLGHETKCLNKTHRQKTEGDGAAKRLFVGFMSWGFMSWHGGTPELDKWIASLDRFSAEGGEA